MNLEKQINYTYPQINNEENFKFFYIDATYIYNNNCKNVEISKNPQNL